MKNLRKQFYDPVLIPGKVYHEFCFSTQNLNNSPDNLLCF